MERNSFNYKSKLKIIGLIILAIPLYTLLFYVSSAGINYPFQDGFEDGNTSWTYWSETAGSGWAVVTGCPTDCIGTYCACAESGSSDTLTQLTGIDLTSYTDCRVIYNTYVDSSFDTGEFYYVDAINKTGSWKNIYACTNGWPCENDTWNQQIYNITAGVGLNNNFKIQVRAVNNDNNEEAGIDNVTITCLDNSTDTCTAGATGNWEILCSDDCVFTTSQNIPNNISITGTGTLTFNNGGKWVFTGSNQFISIRSGCTLVMNTGGGWNS